MRAILSLAFLIEAILTTLSPAASRAHADVLPGGHIRPATIHLPGAHPRLLATQADLLGLAGRSGKTGTFSAAMFAKLTESLRQSLDSKIDWQAAYSGCDTDTYLHLFSFEPAGGYADQIRSDDRLRASAHVGAGMDPPRGAAIVAARAALYAALLHNGAPRPAIGPSADQAAALAKQILQAWARHGFRDAQGNYLRNPEQFCAGDKPDLGAQVGMPLQISRGVIYSAFAQDLLEAVGALNASEIKEFDAFHLAMDELIANGQILYARTTKPLDCEYFSNQVASHIVGRMAIAALVGDEPQLRAILDGETGAQALPVSLLTYFNHAFYGEGDKPNSCFANTGADGATSHPYFSAPRVTLGEVDDRYRNANPAQAIGYSAAVVTHMYHAAEILKIAGFDLYGYRGDHGQSIEAATSFFACYVKGAGLGRTINAANAGHCANFLQYDGKVINAVESNMVIGAYRLPSNEVIHDLNELMKSALLNSAIDPICFGRWQD